ncbi:MAG: peptidoglycan-binding protein, partial [Gammaproteobacteria bacterium]|nr:peptidoglycan-binding protein [Gammaproteobacteria bacterium]
GTTHQLVIAGIEGERVTVIVGNRRVEIPAEQLRELWLGEYLLMWRPEPLADSLMVPGMRSDGVRWLREQLQRLQGGASSQSSFYDQVLADRVRRYQRQQNLAVDGKAGIHTLISLNNNLPGNNEPRLSRGR